VTLFAPRVARAQAEVLVEGANGRAIVGARVDLWNQSAIVASGPTGADGIARFSASELDSARAVLVRRIGFLPAQVALPQPSSRIVVRLEALEGTMPAVTIRAVARACPQADDSIARALWQRGASRYRVPSLEGRMSWLTQATARVSEDSVGTIDGDVTGGGWRAYTRLGMEGASGGLAALRYVRAMPETHQNEMFGAWSYRPLEAELAGHFAEGTFGDAHTLSRVSVTPNVTVLRFCARDRRSPGLDGTMRMDATGALLDARWRYWNPSRDAEPAGGEVVFVPPVFNGPPQPLFSASGLFWRRLPSGRYLQRWQRYTEWKLQPDG
jgi:hypothetical protein